MGLAAAGAVGLETGWLPGSDRLRDATAPLPSGTPTTPPGRVVSGSFVSAARHGVRTGWSVGYPPGHTDGVLPVLVVLHGRGGTHTDAFGGSLHLDRYLARAVEKGSSPFAIASVDGGDHDYWHPRRSGDPAAMVIEEFLPLLRARGLRINRIGLLGWSMGGYGALYLAGRLGRSRVAAAVAESPAIWHTGAETVAGAFDDREDFDAHAIFGRLSLLQGIPLWIGCGAADPDFVPITRDLRNALSPTPAGGIAPGGHDSNY